MDFIFMLHEYLSNLNTFARKIDMDLLDDGNSISLKTLSSPPPLKYLDEGQEVICSFQVTTRHIDQRLSFKTILELQKDLNNLPKYGIKSENNSFIFIECRINSQAIFVEKDSFGWMYTALFEAALNVNKGVF